MAVSLEPLYSKSGINLDINIKLSPSGSKSKSEDSGSKARQYLDGILKIPFGQIKNEPGLEDPGRDLVNELFTKFPVIKDYFKDFGNNYFKILQSVKDFTSDKQCLKMANIGVKKMIVYLLNLQNHLKKI